MIPKTLLSILPISILFGNVNVHVYFLSRAILNSQYSPALTPHMPRIKVRKEKNLLSGEVVVGTEVEEEEVNTVSQC